MNHIELTENYDSSNIVHAACLLRNGGVIAFPTETVYGLGADAENDQAIRRIFEIKKRPADHPLIVHLSNVDQINRWAREIPDSVMCLAKRFWPGPLTIVLRCSSRVSGLVTGGLDTVGIRVPAHPVAQALLQEFGGGIAAPSANRFGRISPTRADHVREELGSAPDLILDGGDCRVGLESTIISLAGDRPTLLRPGMIGLVELCETIGEEVTLLKHSDSALRAPGCHASHYSPLTSVSLVSRENLPALAERLADAGQKIAVLCFTKTMPTACKPAMSVLLSSKPDSYGRSLYATLRQLDSEGLDRILVEIPPDTEPWRAVRDRIQRAAYHYSHI